VIAVVPHDVHVSNELLIIDPGQLGDDFVAGLAAEGFRLTIAPSGEQGVAMAASGTPAAVIVNSDLPGLSGLNVLRLLSSSSSVPVLYLSGSDDEDEVILALEMGAADFLTFPFRVRECAARVWSAIRRSTMGLAVPFTAPATDAVRPEGRVQAGPFEVDLSRREVLIHGERVHARPKEIDLLALLVSNAGRVVPRAQTLCVVWADEVPDRGDSLDVHIRRLRRMIEADFRNPRHIITVRGYGHRFDP